MHCYKKVHLYCVKCIYVRGLWFFRSSLWKKNRWDLLYFRYYDLYLMLFVLFGQMVEKLISSCIIFNWLPNFRDIFYLYLQNLGLNTKFTKGANQRGKLVYFEMLISLGSLILISWILQLFTERFKESSSILDFKTPTIVTFSSPDQDSCRISKMANNQTKRIENSK